MARVKRKSKRPSISGADSKSHAIFVVNGDYFRREAVQAARAFVTPLMGVIAAVSSHDVDIVSEQQRGARKVTEDARY